MKQLNSLIIEGKITKNPKFIETSTDIKFPAQKILSFSVLSERTFKKEDGNFEKEFSCFSVEAFGQIAMRFNGELKKGNTVRIVGRLKQKRWRDCLKLDHSEIVIVAEHIETKKEKVHD